MPWTAGQLREDAAINPHSLRRQSAPDASAWLQHSSWMVNSKSSRSGPPTLSARSSSAGAPLEVAKVSGSNASTPSSQVTICHADEILKKRDACPRHAAAVVPHLDCDSLHVASCNLDVSWSTDADLAFDIHCIFCTSIHSVVCLSAVSEPLSLQRCGQSRLKGGIPV